MRATMRLHADHLVGRMRTVVLAGLDPARVVEHQLTDAGGLLPGRGPGGMAEAAREGRQVSLIGT